MGDDSQQAIQKRVRELEVGMEVASPVHSEDGSCLVQEGKELTAEDISRLKNWSIRRVKIKADGNS